MANSTKSATRIAPGAKPTIKSTATSSKRPSVPAKVKMEDAPATRKNGSVLHKSKMQATNESKKSNKKVCDKKNSDSKKKTKNNAAKIQKNIQQKEHSKSVLKHKGKEVKSANSKINKWLNQKVKKTHMPKADTKNKWSGKPGESNYIKDAKFIPKKNNPKQENWETICKRNGLDPKKGIPYKNGKINLNSVSKGEVKIKNFGTKRYSNFSNADSAYAEQKGISKALVRDMRKNKKLTWHEVNSEGYMQLVPREIHNNIPHSGGVSEKKAINYSYAQSLMQLKSKKRG